LIELSDEEIVAWLTASILDEDGENAPNHSDVETQDFWDRVANAEAGLAALGFEGPLALDRAIGLVGLDESLRADVEARPSHAGNAGWEVTGNTLGEQELLQLHADLLERASQAVANWATLRGSALRAATQPR
jgi:hypothetical protein